MTANNTTHLDLSDEEWRVLGLLKTHTYEEVRALTAGPDWAAQWSRGRIYALALKTGARKTENRIREQLGREHFARPRLVLSDRINPVSVGEIPGAFERIEPSDIWLEGYQCHDAIKAPMAA